VRRARRRERAQAIPAAAAIATAIEARGLTDELRAHDIVASWEAIVGPRLAARCWPDGLSRRVLWIRVHSSPWLQELTMLRDSLREAIARHVGAPALFDELRLHLEARPREPDDLLAGAVPRKPRPPRLRRVPRPAEGLRADAIEAETSAIADDELRELVRGVRLRNDR